MEQTSNFGQGFPPQTFFLTDNFFSASSTVSAGDASSGPFIFELVIFGYAEPIRYVVSRTEGGFKGFLADRFHTQEPVGRIFVKARKREGALGLDLLESTPWSERY